MASDIRNVGDEPSRVRARGTLMVDRCLEGGTIRLTVSDLIEGSLPEDQLVLVATTEVARAALDTATTGDACEVWGVVKHASADLFMAGPSLHVEQVDITRP